MCGEVSDGVLLIDDNSQDRTLDIARRHPAVLNAWRTYQRTDCVSEGCDYVALLSAAQYLKPKWVMILDADERLDVAQFNNMKADILASEYNSISPLWPLYETPTGRYAYWGCGPNGDRSVVKLKFKHDVIMRYSEVTDCPIFPLAHVKPYCRSPQRGFSNLVLKHLCVRPVEERIEKWERRLKSEVSNPKGMKEDEVGDFISKLRRLPLGSPSYDPWVEVMLDDFGSYSPVNTKERLLVRPSPLWEMVGPHWPQAYEMRYQNKQLTS